MKPRLTVSTDPSRFVVHRGDDRLMVDLRDFDHDGLAWTAALAWLENGAAFDVERKFYIANNGLFRVLTPVTIATAVSLTGS